MNVAEIMEKRNAFSFEVFPPKTDVGMEKLCGEGGVLDPGVKEEIDKHGLKLFGVLPQDDAVFRSDCAGEPTAKLPDSDPVKVALRGILQSIGL